MTSEGTVQELQSPGAMPKTRSDEASGEIQSPAMHDRGIQNPTRRDRESQSSVRRDNISHTDSSEADEFYLWKLILRSPLAQSKLFGVFRNEFTVSDGSIDVKDGSMHQSDGNFRRDLRTACTDIRVRVYKFKTDVPEKMQDIEADIEALKLVPGTRKKPVNPYFSGEANIEVIDREVFGEIGLVTTELYFKRCQSDVENILTRNEVDLIPGENDVVCQAEEIGDVDTEEKAEEEDAETNRLVDSKSSQPDEIAISSVEGHSLYLASDDGEVAAASGGNSHSFKGDISGKLSPLSSRGSSLQTENKFLDKLAISLNKEVFRGVDEGKLNTIKKALQKEQDIKMNVEELALSGSARDVGKAQDYLINQLEGDVKHKASDEENYSSGESDDARSDTRYDEIDEQHIFERTLSKEKLSATDHCKKLKNVRREVYMFLKMIDSSKLKEFGKTCGVEFYNCEVTIHSESTERMVECHLFIKGRLSKYDDFYYCDLLSNKPADDVLVAARHVKDVSDDKNDVYFYEDDGTVRLAGQSFERVTEFGNLVEIKLKGNQPRSRGNRNLTGATTSSPDEERGSCYNPNLNAPTPNIERTFRNPTRDAGKQRPGKCVDRGPGCNMFRTDEGMTVYVYKASITNLDVECIVNAANSEMKHGGGIAKVIAQHAGYALEKESQDFIASHGILSVGSTCVTTAGNLGYKHVIHTVGPCITDYSKDEMNVLQDDLKRAIYSALDEAWKRQMASIGIPSVSSGVFGVPKKWCALQYCLSVKDFSRINWDSTLKEIHFIDIDEAMLEVISLTCEVVFNSNQKAKTKLNAMKCKASDNPKHKIRRFFKVKKNFRQPKSEDQYPRVVSVLKIELSPTFQIAVRQGNIVDFEKKGVIVCPQDAELTCHGPIAEAIKEKEVSYYRNLRGNHTNRRYEVGDVLVQPVRSIRCSVVYNVVVPHHPQSRDMNVVRLCYILVFQKADQHSVENIALSLFCTGHGQAIEESARALASALVELANSKKPGHKFPAVYIYEYEKKTTEIVVRVLQEVLLQRNDKTKTNQDADDDDGAQYHQ